MLTDLKQQNEVAMTELGLLIPAEQIYNPNGIALKDAVVHFGGGCTGEVISAEGLVLTNHHCGYGAIQQHSSVEHDYLTDGFWAMSRSEELPCKGLTVTYIDEIMDVTDYVNDQLQIDSDPNSTNYLSPKYLAMIADRFLSAQGITLTSGHKAELKAFYGGNKYYLFLKTTYSDIRMVGAPPSSIGKFGADTDNWMWPRHTGDFSIFRVYAGKDNRPADYSPENVPYRAEKYLKVSLNGVSENDFAMIMGFPGSTERYMTSFEMKNLLETQNPQRIFIRGERQEILWEDMMADDAVRIQYASKYARSSNYWKNSIGMSQALLKLRVMERKQAQEASFQAWAEKQTLPEEGYIDALDKIRRAEEQAAPYEAGMQYISEALLGAVELLTPARAFVNLSKMELVDSGPDPAAAREVLAEWYKDYNPATDRKVAKRMLAITREHMQDLPSFYEEVIDQRFGGDIDAYVDYLYDHSLFTSGERVAGLIDDYAPAKIAEDPAVELAVSVMKKYFELAAAYREKHASYAEGKRKYIAGLMLQQPRKAWAPDANFTIRLTYGQVLPYSPADGIEYNYYTTLKGVMEKEDPENPAEFTVPERLKELYAARDFGRYANERGEMPVAFLANCDITGGNSGSPVMNGRGELIGLAFDGNWEAMSGDVTFEPELQRTIAVDIRYVLFIVDKFAGAGWLLDELDIVQK